MSPNASCRRIIAALLFIGPPVSPMLTALADASYSAHAAIQLAFPTVRLAADQTFVLDVPAHGSEELIVWVVAFGGAIVPEPSSRAAVAALAMWVGTCLVRRQSRTHGQKPS